MIRVYFFILFFICLVLAGDFNPETIECLRVDIKHELLTETRIVESTVHYKSGNGWYVILMSGNELWVDRVEEIDKMSISSGSYTVGSGGDYADLNEWWVNRVDRVEEIECEN